MKIHCRNRAELDAVLSQVRGQAIHLLVLHDDACSPSRCTCSPEYVIEDLTPESYAAGQRAQDEWIRRTSS